MKLLAAEPYLNVASVHGGGQPLRPRLKCLAAGLFDSRNDLTREWAVRPGSRFGRVGLNLPVLNDKGTPN